MSKGRRRLPMSPFHVMDIILCIVVPLLDAIVLPGAQDHVARQASGAGQVGGEKSGWRIVFLRCLLQRGLL